MNSENNCIVVRRSRSFGSMFDVDCLSVRRRLLDVLRCTSICSRWRVAQCTLEAGRRAAMSLLCVRCCCWCRSMAAAIEKWLTGIFGVRCHIICIDANDVKNGDEGFVSSDSNDSCCSGDRVVATVFPPSVFVTLREVAECTRSERLYGVVSFCFVCGEWILVSSGGVRSFVR